MKKKLSKQQIKNISKRINALMALVDRDKINIILFFGTDQNIKAFQAISSFKKNMARMRSLKNELNLYSQKTLPA